MEEKTGKTIGVRIFGAEVQEIGELLKRRGWTASHLLREGLALVSEFDDSFLPFINEQAKSLNVPPHIYLQNMTLAKAAEDDAKFMMAKIADDDAQQPLIDFQISKNGFITGEKFYKATRRRHLNRLVLEEAKDKELEDAKQDTAKA